MGLGLESDEAEKILRALEAGDVDALVLRGADGSEGVFALRTADQAFRVLVETMQEGAAVLSDDGSIVYANRRFADMVGRPLDEVIAHPFTGFIADVSGDDARLLIGRTLLDGRGKGELVLGTGDGEGEGGADGGGVTAHVSASAFEMDGRRAIGLVATDLTDRKRAEKIAEADRAKDQFLAMLSHELRTPLTPVLAAVQMIGSDATLSAEHRETLAMIRRNVELEARLIDDLLDITRISRGKIELRSETVDLHALVKAAVDISARDVAAKRLTVCLELGAASHHVWADPARIEQVCWNLVSNAVKFTPPGGRITCRSVNDDGRGRVRLEVTDTGVGIDPALLPKLFNAFEQGPRAVTRQYGGLGLGLAIAKALAGLHGGSLTAQSHGANLGATFTLELMTAAADPAVGQTSGVAGSANGPPPPAPPPPPACRRVLLVDDHVDTLRVFRRLLLTWGYKVETASDVAGALRAAAAAPDDFDVLVSDIGLPDGTGLDIMARLKAGGSNILGIAVSGFGTDEDVRKSHRAGFEEHLTKPVDVVALRSTLERIVLKAAARGLGCQ